MTSTHIQTIRRELPILLNTTKMNHYENSVAYTMDSSLELYFKQHVRFHLHSIAHGVLNNRDIWSLITDILFETHSITLYSIMIQISSVYTPSMLPFLTADRLHKDLFHAISHAMEINLILYKPQLCPDFVVRIENYNIDIIRADSSTITWVIYTEPVDCLLYNDHLNDLANLIDDAAIFVVPVTIKEEFILTLQHSENINSFTKHFMRIAYHFYYFERYRRNLTEFQSYHGHRWNALFFAWGGTKATLPTVTTMTLRRLIAQLVKISTSINGLVSLVYKDKICHITRFPNKHYLICHIDSSGEMSIPYYFFDQLESLQVKSAVEFVDEYGHLLLKS